MNRPMTFAELDLNRIKRCFPKAPHIDDLRRRNPTAYYRHITFMVLLNAFSGDAVEAGANLMVIYPRWNPREWDDDIHYISAVLGRCKELIIDIEGG